VVHPSDSIQAAVDQAHTGDTVKVLPGVYREDGQKCPAEQGRCAVFIHKDGIRLVGAGKSGHPVVLARKGNERQGIEVARTGDGKCLTRKKQRIQGSLIRGFTVRGFKGDGVVVFCADQWRVTEVRAVKDVEYGIFPLYVGAGRVDHSFASGANDTGIYIGQFVSADRNTATGNTAGILSFALPGLRVKVNRTNSIFKNKVHDNNRPNTCLDPEDVVCNVPAGSGILLVAADRNDVQSNTVKNNDTVGIAVASYCIIKGSSSSDCTNDIEPNPDNNRVTENVALKNGGHPDENYKAFASDLAWDTTGHGNCWSNNTFTKTFPSELPSCPQQVK
jgi:hypothetical protein